MVDDELALIPEAQLDDFDAARHHAHIDKVAGVNHYTMMIGRGPGSSRIRHRDQRRDR
jgi:hypothetical protein